MATRLGVAVLVGLSAQAHSAAAPIGGKPFVDPHHPPTYKPIEQSELAQIALGQSVFETQWVAVGMTGIAGRVGLGSLYNAASCNTCHNGGERGRGPEGDGPAPNALVVQLESPANDGSADPTGDPVYGRVFNTSAVEGIPAEGTVVIRYSEVSGYYYPFGGQWNLRVPHYQLTALSRGPLASHTVIKPRLAPALFGVGLLEAVPESAITHGGGTQSDKQTSGVLAWHSRQGTRLLGRLGWQGGAVSIRDQTANAFAREMGLTSNDRSSDDCTPAESGCRRNSDAEPPEVSAELLDAVVDFVRTLAVPESPTHLEKYSTGSGLFEDTGCAACHRPILPVELHEAGAVSESAVIAPYTDLRLHDLGMEMADEDSAGAKVVSRWRTAPLWGLGYRLGIDKHPTFLHDGRARSTEEAILWHGGEASYAKRKFVNLGPHARETLLRWLATL